jgi:Family of unknown function (DUF5522)
LMGSRSLDEAHPNRLAPTHPMRARIFDAHAAAMAAGEAAYLDPATGLLVLTAERLAPRGHCCDTGCGHCLHHTRPRAAEGSSGGSHTR